MTRTANPKPTPCTLILATGLFLLALSAATIVQAEPRPSSDLLLPYFEVDLTGFHLTTLLQVTNSGDLPVKVKMTVHSNWGIPLEEVHVSLEGFETRAFNLRDWLLLGEIPQENGMLASLTPRRLQHLQAALTGQMSPADSQYYGQQVLEDVAVGYVTVRAVGANRGDVLWGNYFIIDPQSDSAQADVLADIDPAHECRDLCSRHALFFLEGGGFDGGTEVILWNPRQGAPSVTVESAVELAGMETLVRNMRGEVVYQGSDGLMATQIMTLDEMGVTELAGSLQLTTLAGSDNLPVESFVFVRYQAENRYSVAMQSFCLPVVLPPSTSGENAAIDLEKYTNGEDADVPQGPQLMVGDGVLWEYVVTNTGNVPLADVTVSDDDPAVAVSCPEASLAAGESMTCTARGIAVAGQYRNVGSVVGTTPGGDTVGDDDPSHYFCSVEPPLASIDLEKATNGVDADLPDGPQIPVGDPVVWSFLVTNTGEVELSGIQVIDDVEGAIDCPRNSLEAGESMTCTAQGIAVAGAYANLGTAVGFTDDGTEMSDRDPSHYFGTQVVSDQGCTPGYWKNHPDSWTAAGFSPSQSFLSVFSQGAAYPDLAAASLVEALDLPGGSGLDGAARTLARAAVAGLLDASHDGVRYPRTAGEVISSVNDALASDDRDTLLSLAASLDQDNNLGCPLN